MKVVTRSGNDPQKGPTLKAINFHRLVVEQGYTLSKASRITGKSIDVIKKTLARNYPGFSYSKLLQERRQSRKEQTLQLLEEGKTLDVIATTIDVAPSYMRKHLKNIQAPVTARTMKQKALKERNQHIHELHAQGLDFHQIALKTRVSVHRIKTIIRAKL